MENYILAGVVALALLIYVPVYLNWRKMSTHALQKMTRDRFRVMSLAPRQKCPRNVVQMKEAMAAFFWQ